MNKFINRAAPIVFKIFAYISAIIVIIICAFIFKNGITGILKIGLFNFLFGTKWIPEKNIYGIFPMIISSIYVIVLSILFSVPLGIASAVYLSFYAKNKLRATLLFLIELMAGIPSIIFGLFGLVLIVPLIRKLTGYQGQSILVASIILSIMVLPTIITISKNALDSVDKTLYEGSRALGITKEVSIYKIVIPVAKSGILSAIILAISRALGETMAVLMVVGNQARMTPNILKGVRVLTGNIILEMGYASGLHKEALISNALILFFFILIINYIFHKILEKRLVI